MLSRLLRSMLRLQSRTRLGPPDIGRDERGPRTQTIRSDPQPLQVKIASDVGRAGLEPATNGL
jgi:hypothetical protein